MDDSKATGGVVPPQQWRVISTGPGECEIVLPVVTDPKRLALLKEMAQRLVDGLTL